MKPYYEQDRITIYHADCRDVLPMLADGSVDLVLTDPPYGINHPTDYKTRGRGRNGLVRDYPKCVGDDAPFDPSLLLRFPRCILWGANHYADALPTTSGWLVWDKRVIDTVNDQSDAELAWTNCVKGVRCFRHMWNGYLRDSERRCGFHPMQKPVALMRWCLSKIKDVTGTVLDPYMGSGPVAIAARDAGLPYVGIEIEERYCEIAAKRLAQGVFDFAAAGEKA